MEEVLRLEKLKDVVDGLDASAESLDCSDELVEDVVVDQGVEDPPLEDLPPHQHRRRPA